MQTANSNCLRCGFKGWRKTDKIHDGRKVYKCGRCGELGVQDAPFIRVAAKELYLDIETSLTGYAGHFGKRVRGEFLSSHLMTHPYFIICWSALWTDKPNRVYRECVSHDDAILYSDKNILAPLWDLMDRADVIAGHNVASFDAKSINTRFLVNGFESPSDYKTIDTLKKAREKYRFEYNSLDELCLLFGVPQKKKMNIEDWIAIEKDGDEKSLRKMLTYNVGDVKNGNKILSILRGKENPDFGMTRFRANPKDKRIETVTQLDDIQADLDALYEKI